MVVFFCCSGSYKEEAGQYSSVAWASSSLSHGGDVSHVGVHAVSCTASGGIGGTEHRRSVGNSRRTVTETASEPEESYPLQRKLAGA
jgi:hypothetical protein